MTQALFEIGTLAALIPVLVALSVWKKINETSYHSKFKDFLQK